MPAFFFHHFLFHFHMCLFFFNQAILFINMHEGASAWLQGEGDDMTTVGPRMAGMGGNGTPSDLCVCIAHGQFQPPPFFLNVFFNSRYLLPRVRRGETREERALRCCLVYDFDHLFHPFFS
ncbi:hypothetical protein J3F84DRAFT_381563 [Trichoderma pleuroticola]